MGAATIIGAVGLVLSAAGTAAQYVAGKKAEKKAEEQANLEKRQIAQQQKQDELESQIAQRKAVRAARVASAQSVSQTGGLVGGSVITDTLVSQQSSLSGYLDTLSEQDKIQATQYGIAREQAGVKADIATSEAEAAIWKSVIGFAGTATETIGEIGVQQKWWEK